VNDAEADLVRASVAAQPIGIPACPQNIRFDLTSAALIVVDMQNDFCHTDGWLASIGVDVSKPRSVIEPIARVVKACRLHNTPVVWVNWGNRPDRLNLGPSTHHVYDRTGGGTGLGQPLRNGAPVLELGSWSTRVVDELGDNENDVHVAKYSMSGFWDTPLDSILRNLNVRTLLFAGVNLDQCVLSTLSDASARGYDCILLKDCCATTSPAYCADAALYNVAQCFGFVANGGELATTLEAAT
jgi:nicotinamidase-related amidase